MARTQETAEMRKLLKDNGYNPDDVNKLQADDIGPEELLGRIRMGKQGMGTINHTHGVRFSSRSLSGSDTFFGERERARLAAPPPLTAVQIERDQLVADMAAKARKRKPAAAYVISGHFGGTRVKNRYYHPACFKKAMYHNPEQTLSIWPVPKRCAFCGGGPFGPEKSR